MKVALSIGFAILLSLFGARVWAQLDSNALVMVNCPLLCPWCTMTVRHEWWGGSDTGSDYFSSYQELCIGSFGPFRYTGSDSVLQSENVSFHIDTADKMFRNLNLSRLVDGNMISPCVFDRGGYRMVSAELDSVPYTDSSGDLIARGNFPLKLHFEAQVQCQISNHQGLTGFCSDSESMVDDTLEIEIIPNGYLGVSKSKAIPQVRVISLLQDRSGLLVSTFQVPVDVSSIEIFNLLGSAIARIEISGTSSTLDLPSLPPGCYFARLGDEVAKFIVPPR